MNYLIKDATVVNEGKSFVASVFVSDGKIADIIREGDFDAGSAMVIDAKGKYLLPGVIDEHVHFREPGLTDKADIYTESRAAVAGGVTSYMEMPNTVPNAVTQEVLQKKYDLAADKSLANYSFYMGATNDNIDEVVKTDPSKVCGIKVFMGSSTGGMLVDDETTLKNIFTNSPCLVAAHCEDEGIVKANMKFYKEQYGSRAAVNMHPLIRTEEACYASSSKAVELAERCGSRLHVTHVTTKRELSLFRNDIPLSEKRITAEVTFNHLWFSDKDYERMDNFIKCNPAIKTEKDRLALLEGVVNGTIDTIATDHAPHGFDEKCAMYFSAPSGMPGVQHSLCGMLQFVANGVMSVEKVVEMMAHHPAMLYNVCGRGFIRKGYYADLVIVDPHKPQRVSNENVYYKCGWTPLAGVTLQHSVTHTFVNGNLVFEGGVFHEDDKGMRLLFDRN